MLRGVLAACACATLLVAVRSSPQAKNIEELFADRISNNVLEDASLDVPELVRKYNYPLEEHSVTTADGYILGMHRIPHGRDAHNTPGKRPVVFLMHGLTSSSADWILMGPGSAFGYMLAEEGFDVWMGNARGNYYSRRHTSLDPDSELNSEFWQFSWDEIGNIDLPTMIDYALAHAGQSRLHYIGHSQGTTTFFVMTSLRPEYNEKITSMHAFAPVVYMEHNTNPLFVVIAPIANRFEALANYFGLGEFMPNNQILTWAGQALCMDEAIFQPICSNIFFLIGGWSEDQHNATMLPVKLGHTPAGASVRQFAHYAQGISSGEFRRYDYGWLKNRQVYGTFTPPKYDLSKITAPVLLHYSDNDPRVELLDVLRLFSELGKPVGLFRVPHDTFSHLDFLWGIDAKESLFDGVVDFMKSMEIHKFDHEPM